MKRKKIEALAPAKTRKKGNIATVQVLDGILIINFFEDKELKARYCMVTETGEHEYWDPGTGWNIGKLKGCMGVEKEDYYYSWTRTAVQGVRFDTPEDEKRIVESISDRSWRNDPWGKIEYLEETYDREKRWNREQNRMARLDKLMKTVPPVPVDVRMWLFETAGNRDFLFWSKKKQQYGCTSCGEEMPENLLLEANQVKKIRHNDQIICPKCGKTVTVKKKTWKVEEKAPFYLIQETENEAGVIRFFDAELFWTYARKSACIDEGIRIMAYKPGSKKKSKKGFDIYYRQFYKNQFDKGNNQNKRAKDGYLYPGNIQKALEGTVYASAGRLLEQMAAAGERVKYNNLLIGAYGFENYIRTVEYLFKGRFHKLLRETAETTEWWGKPHYYGTLNVDGTTAEQVLRVSDRQMVNRLRDMDGGRKELEWLRWSDKTRKKLPQQTLEWMVKSEISPDNLKRSARNMNPQQIQNYIEKQKTTGYGDRTNTEILEQWEDYLQMCEKMGKNMDDEMVYRPRELKRRHDEVVVDLNQMTILKEMENNKDAKEAYAKEMREKYPQAEGILNDIRERYEFENEEYRIIVPKNLVEIVEEGRALHHCAGSTERYYDRIESRETYICFLRRKQTPGIPFYTIEVEPSGTIRQHRSYLDEEPGIEEIREFLREWQRVIRKRMTKEDKRLAKISEEKRLQNIEELKQKNNTRVLKGLEEDFMENVMEEAM